MMEVFVNIPWDTAIVSCISSSSLYSLVLSESLENAATAASPTMEAMLGEPMTIEKVVLESEADLSIRTDIVLGRPEIVLHSP